MPSKSSCAFWRKVSPSINGGQKEVSISFLAKAKSLRFVLLFKFCSAGLVKCQKGMCVSSWLNFFHHFFLESRGGDGYPGYMDDDEASLGSVVVASGREENDSFRELVVASYAISEEVCDNIVGAGQDTVCAPVVVERKRWRLFICGRISCRGSCSR